MKTRKMMIAGFMAASLASVAFSRGLPSVLTVGADQIAIGSVAGHPARFKVQADGTSTLVLNPDAAGRFGLHGGWFRVLVKVGPVPVNGQSGVTHFVVGGQDSRRRVGWFDRPIAPGFDGVLGPSAVPQDVVVFQLRSAFPGEQRTVLPMADQGYGGVGTFVIVHGQKIFVQWDMSKRTNSATASAAADIADVSGGQFVGKPWHEVVALGVERPVRRVNLTREFVFGPFRLASLVARTTDYGDTSTIPDADADQSEIIVTAHGKKSKVVRALSIGQDAMAGCSSITFDKRAKQIRLSCR
jgi:hypothetical protein